MLPRQSVFIATLVLSVTLGGAVGLVWAQAPAPGGEGAAPEQPAAVLLGADELDELVGPIALYPDDLLALVLPASTFPLDVVQAARFMAKRESDPALKPGESWDPSVLGLLNYPEVVTMMNDDLEWTERLGTAVINQQQDLMDAIQDFRQRASAAGNLASDDKHVIVQEKETIIIQSASPEVIYVPRYDPVKVVVYQPSPVVYYYPTPYPYYWSPAATFWTGMFVGAAIAYSIGGHNGWRRGNVYVNRNVNVNVNRNVNRGATAWKPSRPAAGRSAGSRPGYGGGRPGHAGGGRPGAGSRPTRPDGSRPGAGTRPSRPAAGAQPATRPSRPAAGARPTTSPSRPAAGARPTTRPSRPAAGARPTTRPSRASGNAFGSYDRGSQTARSSQRGARSRSHAGARSGGARGGARGGRR